MHTAIYLFVVCVQTTGSAMAALQNFLFTSESVNEGRATYRWSRGPLRPPIALLLLGCRLTLYLL
jgi:hypothetical protein